MRLVIVSNYFEGHRGGVEIVAGMLGRGLSHEGAEVRWAAAGADRPPSDHRIVPLALKGWNVAERRLGFPYPLISPLAVLKLMGAVRAADAVMLHDSLCLPSISAFIAARLFRKPVVLVQHVGVIPYTNPILRLLMSFGDRLISRPMMHHVEQVAFISEVTRDMYSSVNFLREPVVIFNGVDTNVFYPRNFQPALSRRGKGAGLGVKPSRALFVGRFVEKKGVSLIEQVARSRPDICWTLVGWGPIDPQRWKLPNVRVVGGAFGDALAELYRTSDLLVLPSRGEGFPLVIQEALACGLPVVCGEETLASDPAATDWLRGVRVTGDKAEAALRVSAAINDVLKEGRTSDLRRAEFAKGRYAWANSAKLHFALFRSLLEESKGGSRSVSAPLSQNS